MKRLGIVGWAFVLCIFAVLATPYSYAEESFTEGEQLTHMLSVCLDKKDAIAIATAGEESESLWAANPKCANLPIQGAIVGKVVHKGKVKVVEILAPTGEVLAYFLTSRAVNAPTKGVDGKSLSLKPERNA